MKKLLIVFTMVLFAGCEENITIDGVHEDSVFIKNIKKNITHSLGKNAEYSEITWWNDEEETTLDIIGEVDSIHFDECIRLIETGWIDNLHIDPDLVPMGQRTALIKAWNEFQDYDGFNPEEVLTVVY